jgi:hypothetical protein
MKAQLLVSAAVSRKPPGFGPWMARCGFLADRAKTRRRFNRRPNFKTYDRAEQKKSRKTAFRATVGSVTSSFRTV